MKKVLQILAGLILATIVAEIIIACIVGYPKFFFYKSVLLSNNLGNFKYLSLKEPYTEFWNVEGGNKVYKLNNIGLPGSDVNIKNGNKYIYISGDSYIEAAQLQNQKIASAVLQNNLLLSGRNEQVINIGAATMDIYTSWFKVKYFEKKYPPDLIIYVVEDLNFLNKSLQRFSKPLDFSIPDEFGTELKKNFFIKTSEFIRSKSSLINLVLRAASEAAQRNSEEKNAVIDFNNKNINYYFDIFQSGNLMKCFSVFNKEYKTKFLLISIVPDAETNKKLKEFCSSNGIAFKHNENILSPCNMFNGYGHLNEKGNKMLGDFLYECVKK